LRTVEDISAASPKYAPAPRVATTRVPTTTSTSPVRKKNISFGSCSPTVMMAVPALALLGFSSLASRFRNFWSWISLNSGTSLSFCALPCASTDLMKPSSCCISSNTVSVDSHSEGSVPWSFIAATTCRVYLACPRARRKSWTASAAACSACAALIVRPL
jgi:hypothetical protein